MISFHCSLSIQHVLSFFSLDCVPVCVCVHVFSVFLFFYLVFIHLLIYRPVLSLLRPFIQFHRFLFCHSVHGSFSPWTTSSVSLLAFYLSVYLCICLFTLYKLLAYTVFPSLCQCFSSCQSFSLSVSPFVPISLSLISSPTYVYLCVCVRVRAWACLGCLCLCACFAIPD